MFEIHVIEGNLNATLATAMYWSDARTIADALRKVYPSTMDVWVYKSGEPWYRAV